MTIDASSRKREFINDDLPEFGLPTTAYVGLLLSAKPFLDFFIKPSISASIFERLFFILVMLNPGTSSSSGKLMTDSTSALVAIILSHIILISSANFPLSELCAAFTARLSDALIKSEIASAWIKSTLSLNKALSVNSPGLASLTPILLRRVNIELIITWLP